MSLSSHDSASQAAIKQFDIENIEDWSLGTLEAFRSERDHRNHGNNAPAPPVLLVQGTGVRSGMMSPLHRALAPESNTYAVDLGFTLGDIPTMANTVGKKIDEIMKIEPNGSLRIVGHSLGTLLALEAIKQDTRRSVEIIIGLAPPFGGSQLGWLMSFLPACRQLIPGNKYLRELNEWIAKDSITPLQIHRTGRDYMVPRKHQLPQQSALAPMEIIDHPKFRHGSFLRGATGLRFIEILRTCIKKVLSLKNGRKKKRTLKLI
jgi:pimeloyl-ACP methyl ester carboxylesterase